jgi:methylmalonyl-CoA mutase C-terminal domain/subunit
MADEKKTKVLLAQFPLETHSREIIALAGMLQNHGNEVIVMGNALPANTIERAIKESVDAICICTYGGGEVTLGDALIKCAKEKRIKSKTAFIIGGIINPDNVRRLKRVGFDSVFLTSIKDSGTPDEILGCIDCACEEKKTKKTTSATKKKDAKK